MDLKKLIEKGLELGLTEVEIYACEKLNKSIKVEDGKLSSLNTTDILGYSIRGKYNNKMGCYFLWKQNN